jgi:hypothetical protein
MQKKWIELFNGLMKGEIPFEQEGYIVVTRFDQNSTYAVMELISFKNVKNIQNTSTGVTFHSDGFKTFIVFEPVNYQFRFMEPYLREGAAQVPLRFNECVIIDLPRRDRILMSREPYTSYGSFTVERPEHGNFVYYIYGTSDVDDVICQFIGSILNEDLQVPKSTLPQVFAVIKENLKKFHNFAG